MTHLGEKLKAAIENAGMTQVQFAKKMDMDRTYLNTLLHRSSPPVQFLNKSLAILKIDKTKFLEGTKEKTEVEMLRETIDALKDHIATLKKQLEKK